MSLSLQKIHKSNSLSITNNENLITTSNWKTQLTKSVALTTSSLGLGWILSKLWNGKIPNNQEIGVKALTVGPNFELIRGTSQVSQSLQSALFQTSVAFDREKNQPSDLSCKLGILIGSIGSVASQNLLPLALGSCFCLPSVEAAEKQGNYPSSVEVGYGVRFVKNSTVCGEPDSYTTFNLQLNQATTKWDSFIEATYNGTGIIFQCQKQNSMCNAIPGLWNVSINPYVELPLNRTPITIFSSISYGEEFGVLMDSCYVAKIKQPSISPIDTNHMPEIIGISVGGVVFIVLSLVGYKMYQKRTQNSDDPLILDHTRYGTNTEE